MLRTRRLYLRNLREGDIPAIYAWRNAPECFRYQRWEGVSEAAVADYVQTFRNSVFLSKEEEQHYAICNEEGILGDLSYFHTEEDCCITLGITITPAHQRKGYAREILTAVTGAVRERYPELDIVALIDRENGPSIALFEDLGFEQECFAETIQSYVYVMYGNR